MAVLALALAGPAGCGSDEADPIEPGGDGGSSADGGGRADGFPLGDLGLPPPPGPAEEDAPGLQQQADPGQPCTGADVAGQVVLCVDDDNQSGDEDGTAERPFSQIQRALELARDGEVIQVAGGSYVERLEIAGKQVTLLGGFAGAGDFATRRPATHVTHVDGGGDGSTLTLEDAAATRLDGLRITGGGGRGDGRRQGGGVWIYGGAPTVAHCLIEDNDIVGEDRSVESVGGGLYAEDADLSLLGSVVRSNRSGRGAVVAFDGKALVEGNLVADNESVGDHGGGIYLAGPAITVRGNRVTGNVIRPRNGSGGWGAGIMVFDVGTKALLEGNVVSGNLAPEIGSGTFVDDGAEAVLRNELIVGNGCPATGGAGLYVDGLNNNNRSRARLENVTIAGHDCPGGEGNAIYVENADVEVEGSILWLNGGQDHFADKRSSITLRHSLVEQQASSEGEGNLVGEDPLFVDPAAGDYHLRSRGGRYDPASGDFVSDGEHSPAIDAADPSSDVGAESAPNGGRRNLGAFGGTAEASRSAP